MPHDELLEMADPVLRKVLDHPFWSGLRDGSLPAESLAHFVQQDTGYLLPAYARALARCAATAPEDTHSVFFAQAVCGTLAAKDRLRPNELAPPVDPLTHAHCCFLRAAAATSYEAGVGALLPMVWFNYRVATDLAERCVPGSRYARWIEQYQPGEGYFDHVVRRYLALVDEVGAGAVLTEHFLFGVRYEWTFAESAWRRPTWPV